MINFLRFKKIYALFSTAVIAIGLISIFLYGYNMSIDFTGGTNVEYSFETSVQKKQVELVLKKQKISASRIEIVNGKRVFIKTGPLDEKKEQELRTDLSKEVGGQASVLRLETVGPTLGKETIVKTLVASVVATLGILLYITFSFHKSSFGVAAVLAMFHDLLVLFGTYSLLSRFFGAELDTLFVTAVLTTMSFSVHDTIVVFDKIREYKRKDFTSSFETIANRALTETMVRSLNNSLTIILMLVALSLLGGEVIRFFVLTLLIGTISGTYSSPFVAVPLLSLFEKRTK